MFSFKIDGPQIKVFSAVCSNFVVVWIVATLAASDAVSFLRNIFAAGFAWYAAVEAERRLRYYES